MLSEHLDCFARLFVCLGHVSEIRLGVADSEQEVFALGEGIEALKEGRRQRASERFEGDAYDTLVYDAGMDAGPALPQVTSALLEPRDWERLAMRFGAYDAAL